MLKCSKYEFESLKLIKKLEQIEYMDSSDAKIKIVIFPKYFVDFGQFVLLYSVTFSYLRFKSTYHLILVLYKNGNGII